MNIKETPLDGGRAVPVILAQVVLTLVVLAMTYTLFSSGQSLLGGGLLAIGVIIGFFTCTGYYILEPNQALVVSLFGNYVGTVRATGMGWVEPWYNTHKISTRVRNFESSRAKVNDKDGTPIEIAAIVVWRVKDTAAATYGVTDVNAFVQLQAESAVRTLAMGYPYDSHAPQAVSSEGTPAAAPAPSTEPEASLRDTPDKVAADLQKHIQERVVDAGVEIVEARLSHLAYAPEIAQAMLQRQQAGAVIAARAKIVDGAVGIVQHALEALAKSGSVELDAERKAQMVSNLLVVLCSDRSATPVINAGSIHG